MTGLASDLRRWVATANGKPSDGFSVAVPLGLLRACLIHVERFDTGPLFDRGREAALRAAERVEREREAA